MRRGHREIGGHQDSPEISFWTSLSHWAVSSTSRFMVSPILPLKPGSALGWERLGGDTCRNAKHGDVMQREKICTHCKPENQNSKFHQFCLHHVR